MKKLLLCLAYVCVLVGCSTTKYFLEPVDKVYEYPGLTKNEIYVRANQWFVEKFVSAESVIQFSDKDAGVISGKYVEKYEDPTKATLEAIASGLSAFGSSGYKPVNNLIILHT